MASLTILLWSAGPHLLLHMNMFLERGEAVETKINASAINLDKATSTWASASEEQATSIKQLVGKTSDTMDNLNGEISTFRKTTSDLDVAVNDIDPLLKSMTKASDSLPPAVASLQKTSDSTRVAVETTNKTIADLDARISDAHVADLLAHLDSISASGDHMLSTADQVETKMTKPYLHPSHNPFIRMWDATKPFIILGAKVTANLF